MNASEGSRRKASGPAQQNTNAGREHDQDSEPPRTAVPPGSPKRPFEKPLSQDPTHDQDSDPPRTAVPPK